MPEIPSWYQKRVFGPFFDRWTARGRATGIPTGRQGSRASWRFGRLEIVVPRQANQSRQKPTDDGDDSKGSPFAHRSPTSAACDHTVVLMLASEEPLRLMLIPIIWQQAGLAVTAGLRAFCRRIMQAGRHCVPESAGEVNRLLFPLWLTEA